MAGAGVTDSFDREMRAQLKAVRELLGMDLAFVAERCGGHEVYRAVEGDGPPFGVEPGDVVAVHRSPCPGADASGPVAVEDTGRRGEVGAFACVPVQLEDGEPFGRLCCVAVGPTAPLGIRELRLMEVLAGLVAERVDYERAEADRRALERESGKRQVEESGVGAFLAALEVRDRYTGRHTDAVVDLAIGVAEQLGVDREQAREVGQVALLHDIGKIGVPDSILQKPGPLTDSEWAVMKTHPAVGAEMVASVVGLGHLAPAVRAEHERWDGRGYPDAIRGKEIPLSSRIVFACDAFHAMTSNRPYRPALSREGAVAELERGRGTQFCPTTVDALLEQVAQPEAAVALPA